MPKKLQTSLFLLLIAVLCPACKDDSEFSASHSSVLSRSVVAEGRKGAFAGESYKPARSIPGESAPGSLAAGMPPGEDDDPRKRRDRDGARLSEPGEGDDDRSLSTPGSLPAPHTPDPSDQSDLADLNKPGDPNDPSDVGSVPGTGDTLPAPPDDSSLPDLSTAEDTGNRSVLPSPPPEEPTVPDSALGSRTATSSSLVGTFYDLKLTGDGKRTRLYSSGGNLFDKLGLLSKAYNMVIRNWSRAVLDRFYVSPTQLFASHFYLPFCDARYGPIAYECDLDLVKPSGWVVVYRGRVRAPKTGKFRFVGTGDDFICVRFNDQLVLEAGFVLPTMYDPKDPEGSTHLSAFRPAGRNYIARVKAGREPRHPGYEYTSLPDGWGWNMVGGLTHGLSFDVVEGETYPIEIMISEGPGDAFGFALFMEDMLDNPQTHKPDSERVFDLFRTDSSLPDVEHIKSLLREAGCLRGEDLQCPPYNPNSLIWPVEPVE